MKIDYRDEDHSYRIDDVPVDSVTQILQNVGLIDFSHVSEEDLEISAEFGKHVHTATALFDTDDLVFETLHPKFVPYLDAWVNFKVKTGFKIELIEQRIASRKYMFAGTLDRCGIFEDKITILDIKSGANVYPVTALQTAGYFIAHNEMFKHRKALRRMAVLLKPNGKFQIYPYKDKSDCNVFLAALTLNSWRKRK